jgi:hypothetical protein
VLVKEKGVAGLVAPLAGDSNNNNIAYREERAALKREQLQRNVAAALETTEQMVLKVVKKTPELVQSVKELPSKVREVQSRLEQVPLDLQRTKQRITALPRELGVRPVDLERKQKQSREQAVKAQQEWRQARESIKSTGDVALQWITLQEPRRLAGELVATTKATKEGVERAKGGVQKAVKEVRKDADVVAEAIRAIPGVYEETKNDVLALPTKVKNAVGEVISDVQAVATNVASIPGKVKSQADGAIDAVESVMMSVGSLQRRLLSSEEEE